MLTVWRDCVAELVCRWASRTEPASSFRRLWLPPMHANALLVRCQVSRMLYATCCGAIKARGRFRLTIKLLGISPLQACFELTELILQPKLGAQRSILDLLLLFLLWLPGSISCCGVETDVGSKARCPPRVKASLWLSRGRIGLLLWLPGRCSRRGIGHRCNDFKEVCRDLNHGFASGVLGIRH